MVHVQLCIRTRLTSVNSFAQQNMSGAAQQVSDRLSFTEHPLAQYTPVELENEFNPTRSHEDS